MTGPGMRRVDQLLSELIELIETARAVPMSGSCVVPREHTLDLLDALRDAVPPEIAEAHRVLAQRETLLGEAEEIRRNAVDRAEAAAAALLAEASGRAEAMVSEAEVRAHETVEAGRAEHAELVSATSVHRSATGAAAALQAEAEEYRARTRADAEAHHASQRAEAQEYVAGMRADAEAFADRTLADLIDVLQQATATAEQGRQALASRREAAEPGTQPSISE